MGTGGRLRLRNPAINKQLQDAAGQLHRVGKKKPGAVNVGGEACFAVAPKSAVGFPGSGRVAVTNDTVHGFETRFVEEVRPGDLLSLVHPRTLAIESRVVDVVLSQRALVLREPFSGDVSSTTAYRIVRAPVTSQPLADAGGTACSTETDNVDLRFCNPSAATVSFRVKTGMWSYKTVTETTGAQQLTREEQLDLRVKRHGRDKFC